ncbi:hypothetical protein [Flavobacterium sp. S87F.05.LMB.W.Kidney.N]|uniref:hypothetical protein n=1 Tax=Flavobacterium sp. S87F.05.LMB.W.Kidney.N TaxID=1278758 RepID=UPI0010656824|nr:hypothetical protein [Flavobacterium sp. S87F.05.LMB.W.Kidney.N]TDX14236.1 hypothetical protein EDB96_0966 [Flavobacterium sp. S87F.05.LMB.W.Kidney.N]
MKKICLLILILLCSCQQKKFEQKENTKIDSTSKEHNTSEENIEVDSKKFIGTNWFKVFKTDTIIASEMYWKKIIEKDSLIKIFKADFFKSPPLKDKKVKFFWYDNQVDPGTLINKEYCKTMSEPERAALGFVAKLSNTFDTYYDKGNKSCSIHIALNLDYPCSKKYKYFMQYWFRNDTKYLNSINNCSPVQETFAGSSNFDAFNEISITVKGNNIFIDYEIGESGRDIRHCKWNSKISFLVDKDNIKVIDWKESEEDCEYYYPNYSDHLPPPGYKDDGTGTYRLVKKSKKK